MEQKKLLFFYHLLQSTVIPAMVQRLFFAIITQRDHKYATPPPWKQFYVFLATAPIGVLTAGTSAKLEKLIYGKGVAHLWKNEGVAPLRELLYSMETIALPELESF